MVGNRQIGRLLREIAAQLEAEEVAFKPRAYEKAAQAIEVMEEPVASLFDKGGVKAISTIPGVGKSIAEKIAELLETGKVHYLEEMKAKRPMDLMGMIAIEGVGPKTARALYDALGIRSVEELERAAQEGKIRSVRGFGEKSEQEILRGLEFLRQHRGRFLLGDVVEVVAEIESALATVKGVRKVTVAGSIRRRKETVGDVDFLVISKDPEKVMDVFVSLPHVAHVYGKGKTKSNIRLANGLDVDVRVVSARSYGAALNYFTGSKQHNVGLRRIALEKHWKLNEYGLFDGDRVVAGPDEEGLYEALGLAFVPPELREDRGEIEAARAGTLPDLIGYGDLKGDLQTQTGWSDGKHSIEEMVRAARERGLEYIAITDHTKSLAMTGLDEDRLLEQTKEIDRLNRRLRGFRILKGAEVNILKDGSLDISDDVLAKLDIVGVAVHSHFHLGRREMTERICRALRNPHVDVLFHPTGRVLLKRDPYPVDLEAVIRVARETQTILEIDAIPDRLDLKDEHIRMAVEAGVKLAIDSDAHAMAHFGFLELGIGQARRGWSTRADIVNTLPVDKLLSTLEQ